MIKILIHTIRRECILQSRRIGEMSAPLCFFVMVCSLFPLGLGPDKMELAKIAPAVIWIAVVLSLLWSAEHLFRLEYEDGTFEQMILSPYPLPLLMLGKSLAHWLMVGLPLLCIAPFLGFLYHLPFHGTVALFATLALGTPLMCFVCAIGVALTLVLHRGGLLLAILLLPLMVPVVILGINGVVLGVNHQPFYAEMLLLLALLIFSTVFAPIVVSAAIKISLE